VHDLRDAFRALKATPVVTAVAILSLALGIGANTAIFSLLDSLLLRSLPVTEPQRLVVVGNGGPTSWTNPVWEQIRGHQDLFDGALATSNSRFNLAESGIPDFVDEMWVSGSYFDVLGVSALLGRTLKPSDDRRGGGPDGPVAVIGYSFWQRRFGGAANVIGRSITVERVPFTIVGVTPPDFFGTEVGRQFEVAIPLGTEPLIRGKESSLDRRSTWWLQSMVRLKPGQPVQDAEAALRGVQPLIRDATTPQDWKEEDKKEYLKEAFTLEPAATGSSFLRTRYLRQFDQPGMVLDLQRADACRSRLHAGRHRQLAGRGHRQRDLRPAFPERPQPDRCADSVRGLTRPSGGRARDRGVRRRLGVSIDPRVRARDGLPADPAVSGATVGVVD
jgi:hypothetical protein